MQYMMLNYVPTAAAKGAGPAAQHADMAAWAAYTKAIIDAGVMRAATPCSQVSPRRPFACATVEGRA